jgi:molybdopterin synthase catalytic subunit
VTGLTYEAWEEQAVRRLEELATSCSSAGRCRKVAFLHRFGELAARDVSVVVACSSPHRPRRSRLPPRIEQLKTDVPIWKKEHLVYRRLELVMGS